MNTQRTRILEAMKDRVEDLYGPKGKQTAMLRQVKRGRWNVGEMVRPCCTVVDGGQSVDAHHENSAELILRVTLMIEFDAKNRGRGDDDDYSNVIQDMVDNIQNWAPEGVDVNLIDYVNDEPWDVQFSDQQHIWHAINFDVEYHVEFGEYETTSIEEE